MSLLNIYSILMRAASSISPLLRCAGGKTSRAIEARRGLRSRWADKTRSLEEGKKTVWFHFSSAGEFLQARPVIDILSKRHAGSIQIALTFFSPSGYDYYTIHDRSPKDPSVVFVDYLPLDTPADSSFALDSLSPDLIAYVRYDVWPNLVTSASSRGIPQVLLSALFHEDPGIVKRWLYRNIYSALTAISTVSERDAAGFSSATGGNVRVVTTGDTRFDQVIERIERSSVKVSEAILSEKRRLIIAGSTWPEDEKIVIPGFARIAADKQRETALVIAPHEPGPERLSGIERSLDASGISHTRYSRLEESGFSGCGALIVDGIGYLAELYRAGSVAYVGGGWTTGVHNILEPAVLGLPVFFGPRTGNAWEAGLMVESKAASFVSGEDDFAEKASSLLDDPLLLKELSDRASAFVRERSGASEKCAALLEESLGL